MKKVAAKLKLAMAQYRELAAFAQFGTSELDKATKLQIDRGKRIEEVLKQLQFAPMPLENQVIILFAVINGYIDDLPVDKVREFESKLLASIRTTNAELVNKLAKEKDFDDKMESEMKDAITDFKKSFMYV
jgi:F-type H+-transporting ATPase subunit alpha